MQAEPCTLALLACRAKNVPSAVDYTRWQVCLTADVCSPSMALLMHDVLECANLEVLIVVPVLAITHCFESLHTC